MDDDNNGNGDEASEASQDSGSNSSTPTFSQCDEEDLRATLQNMYDNTFDNPCPKMRMWLQCQSGRIEKLKNNLRTSIQIEINEGFVEMTQFYKEKGNQESWEEFSEILQKSREMMDNSKSSLNQEFLKQLTESSRKKNAALKEEQERLEKDSADAIRIYESLSVENREKVKHIQEMQEEISQKIEAIRDLFKKIPEAMDSYVLHMRERKELEKRQIELESLKVLLRDSRETTENLTAEVLKMDMAQVDEEKSLERKLATVKQMSEYVASNEKIFAEMKAKEQNLEARNKEKRGYMEIFEEIKSFHEEEMKSKEEILQQAVDYRKKLKDMEGDNESVLEMRDYLMRKKQGIEDNLKAVKEEVAKLEEQNEKIDENRKKQDDLELSLEVAEINRDSSLNRRRRDEAHNDFSDSSSDEFRFGDTLKSLILNTPKRTDRDSP